MARSVEKPTRSAAASAAGEQALLPDLQSFWAETRGDPRICIAVLDGPVDVSHPCFAGANLTQVPTLVPAGVDGGPASRHGTHVASLIFGQPGAAVAGVAPRCRGLILPVFSSATPDSLILCSQLDLARAILQAVVHGAHVINISGGQLTRDGEPEPLLAKAMQACADNNVLVVAAAGNDGCECLHVPAALASALAVGAMDGDGAPIEASNWGGRYRTQGILARGQNILGASPGGGVSKRTGTSFATPLVSGLAALLLSVQLGRGEKPDPHAVRRALLKSAMPCQPRSDAERRRCLAGAVNPAGALTLVQSGGTDMHIENAIGAAEAPASIAAGPMPADAIRTAEAAPPFAEPRGEAGVTASELAPQKSEAPSAISAPAIAASDCGCGGTKAAPDAAAAKTCACAGTTAPTLVYALGKLHYDFQTEARRDRFVQFMPADPRTPGAPANPYDPEQIARYLAEHPHEADALTWTLNLDATPIYAIAGAGPFASVVYDKLRDCFGAELNEGAQLVSIAGTVAGSVRLYSGQVVPLVIAARQGIFCWSTQPLVTQVLGVRPEAQEQRALYDRRLAGLNNFLDRVYYDLRNLGVAPQDRALNYAATNAFQIGQVMETAARGDLELDTVKVHKSPVCRPDSDCYDVEVGFYNPQNVLVANRVYRFTIDVSDVIPVTIGDVRSWSKRS